VETPPPTAAADEARLSKLKEILITISPQKLPEEKHSIQFKAFMWMIHLDPSPFDVDTTPRHMILQKYVSIAGREWKNQNLFLTSASVCNWGGLECSDEKEIVIIDLEGNNLKGTIVSNKTE
jgi:hypothetical protein